MSWIRREHRKKNFVTGKDIFLYIQTTVRRNTIYRFLFETSLLFLLCLICDKDI